MLDENPIHAMMTVNGLSGLALKAGGNETPLAAGVWLMMLLPDDAEIEPGIRVIAVDNSDVPDVQPVQAVGDGV